jgi:hypothetical protein
VLLAVVAGAVTLVACENPFSPKSTKPPGPGPGPAPDATTPEQFMENLRRAMRDRDGELYETLLDEDFLFTEPDCQGDLVFHNGREEEIAIMSGSRDGSQEGIFDRFAKFEYEFRVIRRSVELGVEHPEAYPGDPDGHPDEDWEVFYGDVEMRLLDSTGLNGFAVDQKMTYKLRQGSDGLWRIVRWIDDPLSGDCGAAEKPAGSSTSWASVKSTAPSR